MLKFFYEQKYFTILIENVFNNRIPHIEELCPDKEI